MIKRIASTVIRSVPLSQWGKTAAEKTGRAENRTRDKTDRSVFGIYQRQSAAETDMTGMIFDRYV
ncbi:MAG TPA: hypothetical protein VMW23_08025 [Sedimentisphaerales bacterium]|nr:hypothetical protein [Sedimentisphaerales bacterium]